MPGSIKTRAITRNIKKIDRGASRRRRMRPAARPAPAARLQKKEGDGAWQAAREESEHTAQAGCGALRRSAKMLARKRGGARKEQTHETRARTESPVRANRRQAVKQAPNEQSAKDGMRGTWPQAIATRKQRDAHAAALARKRAEAVARASSLHASPEAPARPARAAAKAAARFARMAAAQARAAATAAAGVGASAATAVVVVCIAGFITISAFGIFFAGGNMGDDNPSLREVIAALDAEHQARINNAKSSEGYDEMEISGAKTPWKEVLAVFAVKMSTDPVAPVDVITMDEKRQNTLRDVFWDMNSISATIEERQDPGEGSEAEALRILRVVLTGRSAEEIATAYGFNAEQKSLLLQLLDERNDAAWGAVLYEVAVGDGSDIVEVAASQLGNVGGRPYWSWYGFGSRVEWCACFVSWCANECGYIESGRIPKFSYCPTGVEWFKAAGRWAAAGSEPSPGDIVFFDWQGDGVSDHVGIVESCDKSIIITIEGNSGDACKRNSYAVGSPWILGYGTD